MTETLPTEQSLTEAAPSDSVVYLYGHLTQKSWFKFSL